MKPPTAPVHPGRLLATELGELGISANAFAQLINVPANRISELIRGRRGVTADTALRLERFFGKGALYWMELQSRYDVRMRLKASHKEFLALPTIRTVRGAQGGATPRTQA